MSIYDVDTGFASAYSGYGYARCGRLLVIVRVVIHVH
jgi:hypothetical protein